MNGEALKINGDLTIGLLKSNILSIPIKGYPPNNQPPEHLSDSPHSTRMKDASPNQKEACRLLA